MAHRRERVKASLSLSIIMSPFVPLAFALLLATLSSVDAQPHPNQTIHYNLGPHPWQQFSQTEYQFSQAKINHFATPTSSSSSSNHWVQRFFVVNDFFTSGGDGPVFYFLCGEYECPGVMTERLFPVQLALENSGLIVVVEHRYFGYSYPTPPGNDTDLALLTSKQALQDFALFQIWFQEQFINIPYQRTPPFSPSSTSSHGIYNPWIVVGGSYPGALSAWYRLKYPHLVIGSLASSAVVNAVYNFTDFDKQVRISSSLPGTVGVVGNDKCTDALVAIGKAIEGQIPSVYSEFQAADGMDAGDFMFLIADVAAESIQYGHRHLLCDSITPTYVSYLNGKSNVDDLVGVYANYTINYYYSVLGNNAAGYDRRTFHADSTSRSWWYMTCAEVGYWQVAPSPSTSIRSQLITLEWYQTLCSQIYNISDSLPPITDTNIYYGADDIVLDLQSSSNIFFTNGIEDEWQWAGVRNMTSVQGEKSNNVIARLIDCDECAHCVEMYSETDQDSVELRKVRNEIRDFVGGILNQWQQGQQPALKQLTKQ